MGLEVSLSFRILLNLKLLTVFQRFSGKGLHCDVVFKNILDNFFLIFQNRLTVEESISVRN